LGLNEKNLGLLDELMKYAIDHQDILRLLGPDVADALHECQSVNRALAMLFDLARAQLDDKLRMS